MSRPIRWQAVSRSSSRRRACWVYWRTVRPCRATRYTRLLFRKKLPLYAKDTQISGVRSTRRLSRQQILEDPSTIFFMSLGPHVGAQSPCACPPSAIKGEACDVTHTHAILDSLSSYKLLSNTTHSGVGYYAPAARTTLNPCVFPSSSSSLQRSSKTPKPLLILGLRAGALRHPAGDFLSDNIDALHCLL
jgi:hypothetical protein